MMSNKPHLPMSFAKSVVVLLACGLVALAIFLGIFCIRKSIRRSQDERFFREIMLMQDALEQYTTQAGSDEPTYPAINYDSAKKPNSRTPIDGKWRLRQTYDSKNRPSTEIVVEDPNRTMKQMEELDATIDDGDLATGKFRLLESNTYSLQVLDSEPAPVKSGEKRRSSSERRTFSGATAR
jgi:hypothetical protein